MPVSQRHRTFERRTFTNFLAASLSVTLRTIGRFAEEIAVERLTGLPNSCEVDIGRWKDIGNRCGSWMEGAVQAVAMRRPCATRVLVVIVAFFTEARGVELLWCGDQPVITFVSTAAVFLGTA
jgi:hypothetical protein